MWDRELQPSREKLPCLAVAAIVAILSREKVTGAFPVWLGVHRRLRCHLEREAGPESDGGVAKVFLLPLVGL